MNWDWHTIILIMGVIAFIEVYRLFKIINEQADEIDNIKRVLRRNGLDPDRPHDIEEF